MSDDEKRPAPPPMVASNDDCAAARVDRVVVTLARLLGRQIAREVFAANDNRPTRGDGTEPSGSDRP